MNSSVILAFAGLYGVLAVGLGAFAAHGLKARLDDYALGIMATATHYALIHAVALLVLAMPVAQPQWRWAALAFVLGVALFSGSLYVLALTGVRWWGAVTPLGGLCLLAGWGWLLLQGLRS